MIKYLKITGAIAMLALMASCKKYLDKTAADNYQITDKNYLLTESDYRTQQVSVYTPLQWLNLLVPIGDIASDNSVTGGESASDVLDLQQIDKYTQTPVNGILSNLWQYAYEGVNRANYLTQYYATNPAGQSIGFVGKDAMYGEVYFLRAYYYFTLTKMFGDVPLVTDKRLDISATGTLKRTSKATVYLAIENDLKAAIGVLPIVQSQTGRATKFAALALLGKVYLYQKKYDSAAAVLQNVISSNSFSLISDFNAIFEKSGENGVESVFEIQYSSDGANSYTSADPAQGPGNYAVQLCGVRELAAKSTSMPYASGYSINLPTQNLASAYAAGDQRKAVTCFDVAAYTTANPAYGISFLTAPYENTGLYNKKYLPHAGQTNTSGGAFQLNYKNNYRTIRYADVLLMAAEANNQKSSPDDVAAQTYLNLVRRRAFGDNEHDISLTGNNLYTTILNERKLELAMEGERFFDLVRTGQAAATLGSLGFVTGKNELFPIPNIEISLSGLTQNPGY